MHVREIIRTGSPHPALGSCSSGRRETRVLEPLAASIALSKLKSLKLSLYWNCVLHSQKLPTTARVWPITIFSESEKLTTKNQTSGNDTCFSSHTAKWRQTLTVLISVGPQEKRFKFKQNVPKTKTLAWIWTWFLHMNLRMKMCQI